MPHLQAKIRVFTTCPPYAGAAAESYLGQIRRVARWSDDAGCEGILVYTDNSTLDPWQVADEIIQCTGSLSPLVAVQPVYMHPYTVAKAISSIAYRHRRRISLNIVAGGFKNDLIALNDATPHERRYDRLVEYTTIIKHLLAGQSPVTFEGDFYTVRQLNLKPALPPELFPVIMLSGSSADGLAAARALEAIPVKYPEPAEQNGAVPPSETSIAGIRVGIIAREDEESAWLAARQRFPEDRAGKIMHNIATKVSDSVWHKRLSELSDGGPPANSTYWLEPFRNYRTFCPYLVGSYTQVAAEIRRYMLQGCNVVILDVPAGAEELVHIQNVFSQASEEATAHVTSTHA